MILPTKVQFADDKLKKAFYNLKQGQNNEKELYKFLERAFKDIEQNGFCGIQVPKNLIPRSYIQKYEVTNLWKYDLPNAWRLLYSIKGNKLLVISIVIEWMNHKDYERRFKY